MSWQLTLTVTGTGALVVAAISVLHALWTQTQQIIPAALSRVIRRDSYLRNILALSQVPTVDTLDVLTARLRPRGDSELIGRIQDAWAQVNARGRVRVLTVDTESCLAGAVELMGTGIEVRVTSSLDSDDFSYHLFSGKDTTTVLNTGTEQENVFSRLPGVVPAGVVQNHFDMRWESAIPAESVFGRHALEVAGRSADTTEVRRRLRSLHSVYSFDEESFRRVVTHTAFVHDCRVIFILGLPGAGKSFVRRRLAAQLRSHRIRVAELTDYGHAYGDFIYSSIRLDPSRGAGFYSQEGGAFGVRTEDNLLPALRGLAHDVTLRLGDTEVILVEFARSDLHESLRQFSEEVLERSHIVHVHAPDHVRNARLSRRARPPVLRVSGLNIQIDVSDDHALPRDARESLYQVDDVSRLITLPLWRDRTLRIDNSVDDERVTHVDAALRSLTERVVHPYLPTSTSGGHMRQSQPANYFGQRGVQSAYPLHFGLRERPL